MIYVSHSNSSLIKWAKSMHFWTCTRQTTLISQLGGQKHKSFQVIGVVFWSLSKPCYITSSKSFFDGHLPNKQGSSSSYKQYPQGITDKLFLTYQTCEHLWMALPTGVKVTRLIYRPKTTSSYPLSLLTFTPKRSKRHLENVTMIWSRDQNGFTCLPPFLTTFPR